MGPASTASAAAPAPVSLSEAFEAAWARQPEALALQTRREAAAAQQRAVRSWTPEPLALELSNRTDRLGRDQGARETEFGVALPLWLPGERGRQAALAAAESAAVESRATAARLRVAADVRALWWPWQRARVDADSARDQLASARRIAADVALRTRAGDLARADRHQADGAVAAAESALAQAAADEAVARQALRGATGSAPADAATEAAMAEPEPQPQNLADGTVAHAALIDLRDRADVAERAAALVAAQPRAHPELVLATTRERGSRGEPSLQTVTLGLRIALGAGARQQARWAGARADALELQAQLALERDRLQADQDAARARIDAARTRLSAAERRAQLARESRGFFDKSFRLGETDLPTRLRIETEAAEADRQSARARIDQAAAISAWRQALGLLPP